MDRIWGLLLNGTPTQWRLIKEEIVMHVGDLGTWPTIAGTRDKGVEWQRIGEWSMGVEELRRS